MNSPLNSPLNSPNKRTDGCLFNPAGVRCHLPQLCPGIPPECARCGWFPAEAKRRKLERIGGEP